jgi:hypothetical protein
MAANVDKSTMGGGGGFGSTLLVVPSLCGRKFYSLHMISLSSWCLEGPLVADQGPSS